jgi:hypothetical protein
LITWILCCVSGNVRAIILNNYGNIHDDLYFQYALPAMTPPIHMLTLQLGSVPITSKGNTLASIFNLMINQDCETMINPGYRH